MTDRAALRALLEEALAESDAAPLSVRRAMLVVMLIDALADHVVRSDGADPLQGRAMLAARSPELETVLGLAAHRDTGAHLVIEEVPVPIEDYQSLSTAEFMVSLYNERTVPRLLVARPGGARRGAHEVLHGAVRALHDETPEWSGDDALRAADVPIGGVGPGPSGRRS